MSELFPEELLNENMNSCMSTQDIEKMVNDAVSKSVAEAAAKESLSAEQTAAAMEAVSSTTTATNAETATETGGEETVTETAAETATETGGEETTTETTAETATETDGGETVTETATETGAEETAPETATETAAEETAEVVVEEDPAAENAEQFAFSADIAQLMSLIINTFYSNKDIFLRELISNASDALDKIRYQSLTDATALKETEDLDIKITADRKNKTLTIEDTGLGMTKSDLVNNLGTIAKSGTKAFMEALKAGGDVSMIGQFGVGFYSAFLVASKVTVVSKNNDDEEHVWESDAGASFKLYKSTNPTLKRGTRIILNIKPGCEEYLVERKLRSLISKHSNFICFKMFLLTEREVEVPVETAEETETVGEDDEVLVEEVKEAEKKTKKVKKLVWDHLNTQKAIWLRPTKEITNDEYAAFYKSISNDYQEHLAVAHFKMEGSVVFNAVLFIPQNRPRDMFNNKLKSRNIKLYVRRVLVSDKFVKLMPKWLCFMTGIVDSDDLPLNISREVLQENRILKVISKNLIKKSLKAIEDLNEENYKKFYSNFAKCLKLGVYEDTKNRNQLLKLLRFDTTKEEFISLDQYVEGMKENQKDIYYITGANVDAVKNAHFLEKLKKRGYDCLLLTDTMDEYVVQAVREYEGKKLVCVTKEGLDLGEDESEKAVMEENKKALEKLCKTVKEVLGDNVKDVVVSSRMVDSPCCLVSTQYGHTANMERIMRAQTIGAQMQQLYFSHKIMELNPEHNIVKLLKEKMETEASSKIVKDLVWLLYDTSLLSSGYSLQKPLDFAKRIHKLVELGLGGEEDSDDDSDELPPIEGVHAAGCCAGETATEATTDETATEATTDETATEATTDETAAEATTEAATDDAAAEGNVEDSMEDVD